MTVFTPATFNFLFLQKGVNFLLWPRHSKHNITWRLFLERGTGSVLSLVWEWLHNNRKGWVPSLPITDYESFCHSAVNIHPVAFPSLSRNCKDVHLPGSVFIGDVSMSAQVPNTHFRSACKNEPRDLQKLLPRWCLLQREKMPSGSCIIYY